MKATSEKNNKNRFSGKEGAMTCTRCGGLMVQDSILDLMDTDIRAEAWRCISCGDVVDSVILANRNRHRPKAVAREMAEALFNSDIKRAKAA